MRNFVLLVILALTLIELSCNPQARGFALPPGNVEEGRITFIELRCNQCHSIGTIPWGGQPGDLQLELGGKVSSIKTYGELLTSVINPSHRIAQKYEGRILSLGGKSRMRNYNDVMTVQQMIDLVAFLQGEYSISPPSYYHPY